MTTNQALIDALASDIRPVSPRAVERSVVEALIAGGGIALVGVVGYFGIQPDLGSFAHGAPFLLKSAYAVSLGGIAIALTLLIARPGAWTRHGWRFVSAPVALLAILAFLELARAPMVHWPHLLMGDSWAACPWRIVILSVPVFAGLCVALRRQAPIDLRSAGAAAGLLSGAVAATVYALACPESSAAFILVWYSLGIALATVMGALLGPKVLRW